MRMPAGRESHGQSHPDDVEGGTKPGFHADRISPDSAWRKVKPFGKVDEAVVRYLT
jgi:hypothetical protein